MNFVKTSSVNTRENGNGDFPLREYLDRLDVKPLEYFGDVASAALNEAEEYLRIHPESVVEVPAGEFSEYKSYVASKRLDGASVSLNVITFGTGAPDELSMRPFSVFGSRDWQVGDIIVNLNQSSFYTNAGWVCVASGNPNSWAEFGHNRRHYSDIEIVKELPEADESQEGRLLILQKESSSVVYHCINTSEDQELFPNYEWTELRGGGGGYTPVPTDLNTQINIVRDVDSHLDASDRLFKSGDTACLEIVIVNDGDEAIGRVTFDTSDMDIVIGDSSLQPNEDASGWFVEGLQSKENLTFHGTRLITDDDIEGRGVVRTSIKYKVLNYTQSLTSPVIHTEPIRRSIGIKDNRINVSNSPELFGMYGPGEAVEFETTVTNTSNVNLKNFIIRESLDGAEFIAGSGYVINPAEKYASIDDFPKGTTVTFKSRYIVKDSDLGRDDLRNSQVISYSEQDAPVTVESRAVKTRFPIPDTIEDASWKDLSDFSDYAVSHPELFSDWVGQKKTVSWGENGTHTVTLIGIAHDDLADGSGKAAFTFLADDCVQDAAEINAQAASLTYDKTTLRTTVLPGIYNQIENNVKNYIVKTRKNLAIDMTDTTGTPYEDYLHLLSVSEVFPPEAIDDSVYDGASKISRDALLCEGELYDYFSDPDHSKVRNATGDVATTWYLRSIGYYEASSSYFCGIDDTGSLVNNLSGAHGIVPSFSIGAPRKGISKGETVDDKTWGDLFDTTGDIHDSPEEYEDLVGQTKTEAVGDYGELTFTVADVNHYGKGDIVFFTEIPDLTAPISEDGTESLYRKTDIIETLDKIYESFPEDMKKNIITTDVIYYTESGSLNKTGYRLFLPSKTELGFSGSEGTEFKLFKDSADIVEGGFWTRSLSKTKGGKSYFNYLDESLELKEAASDEQKRLVVFFAVVNPVPNIPDTLDDWDSDYLEFVGESAIEHPDEMGDLVGKTLTVDTTGYGDEIEWMVVDIDHEWEGQRYGMVIMPKEYCLGETVKLNETVARMDYGRANLPKILEGQMFDMLPDKIKDAAKLVTFKYNSEASTGAWSASANSTKSAKIFLPCIGEIFDEQSRGTATNDIYKQEGTPFRAFTDNSSRIRKIKSSGSNTMWWLRSIHYWHSSNLSYFGTVYTDGSLYSSGSDSNTLYGVCPCIAIGSQSPVQLLETPSNELKSNVDELESNGRVRDDSTASELEPWQKWMPKDTYDELNELVQKAEDDYSSIDPDDETVKEDLDKLKDKLENFDDLLKPGTKHSGIDDFTPEELVNDVLPQTGTDPELVEWLEGQELTYTYDAKEMKFRVIGVNHDICTDTGNYASITLQATEIPYEARVNDTNVTTGGWRDTEIRTNLNSEEGLAKLPEGIRDKVKEVYKLSYGKVTIGATPTTDTATGSELTLTKDKVFLASASEIATRTYYNGSPNNDGNQYPIVQGEGNIYGYWKEHDNFTDHILQNAGANDWWWTRSISVHSTARNADCFRDVYNTGVINAGTSYVNTTSGGIVPCFCLGDSGIRPLARDLKVQMTPENPKTFSGVKTVISFTVSTDKDNEILDGVPYKVTFPDGIFEEITQSVSGDKAATSIEGLTASGKLSLISKGSPCTLSVTGRSPDVLVGTETKQITLDIDGTVTTYDVTGTDQVDISYMSWSQIEDLGCTIVDADNEGGAYDYIVGQTIKINTPSYGGDLDWVVVDVNHQYGNRKYGLVFMPKTYCLGESVAMNAKESGITYDTATVRDTLETEIYNNFPEDIRNRMQKVTYNYNSSAEDNQSWAASANSSRTSKIFLPCVAEMFDAASRETASADKPVYQQEGTTFKAFTDDNSRIRKIKSTEDATYWWLRSIDYWHSSDSNTRVAIVTPQGVLLSGNVDGPYGICPIFCIGTKGFEVTTEFVNPKNSYQPGETVLFNINVKNLSTVSPLTDITVTIDKGEILPGEGYTVEDVPDE